MTLWHTFMVDHHFIFPSVSLLSRKRLVAYLCWLHSAVSRRCIKITIWNQFGNHANQCPACNHWKYCSVLISRTFPEGDVENYWSVKRWHLHHVRENNNLTQGLRGHLFKAIASKEYHAILLILRWKSFLSASRSRWGRSGRPVIVRTVQGRFVAAGYRSHPGRCPRLTPHRCCGRHMLADRPQTWNHQRWSHAIFDDDPRVSLYHSDPRVCEFRLFRGWNHQLTFQRHDEKVGHVRYSCRGWLWTHQQKPHETSADGSTSGACEPTCSGSNDGQESVWGIGLDGLGDIQRLLNILGPCRQRRGVQFAWSALPWFWTAERICSASGYIEGQGLHLLWSSSIDAHVASG